MLTKAEVTVMQMLHQGETRKRAVFVFGCSFLHKQKRTIVIRNL
jgi:hypothetical protein